MVSWWNASLGCANFNDEFYRSLTRILLTQQTLPDPRAVSIALRHGPTPPRLAHLAESELRTLHADLQNLYQLAALNAVQLLSTNHLDADHNLEAILALDMGDRGTTARDELGKLIQRKFASIAKSARHLENTCPVKSKTSPPATAGGAVVERWQKQNSSAVVGAWTTMNVSYQSCHAADLAPLTRHAPNVGGIAITGTHPDQIGRRRGITDLAAFRASQPYLEPDNGHPDCQSLASSKLAPPTYNYGGKPLASLTDNSLNLFAPSGTGTKLLGIDCSGFIYTAFATAGLKLKVDGDLLPEGVYGVRASQWLNPQKSGLTCFDEIEFSGDQSIQPGDILASKGHIVMIDTVKVDPFGILQAHHEDDCLPARLSAAGFHFSIIQSSPSKGGIGINRIWAADYFDQDEAAMTDALKNAASAACLAHVRQARVKPVTGGATLSRHRDGDACRGDRLSLEGEVCLRSCE